MQSERSRFFVTRTANSHVQKNNAVLLASHPIRITKDHCVTVSAKELHSRRYSNSNAVREINSHDKEFLKTPGAVPYAGTVRARLFRSWNALRRYQITRYFLRKNMIRCAVEEPAVNFLAAPNPYPKRPIIDLPPVTVALLLTFGSELRYSAPMPIQFILPKKFTRDHIEWRVDELALQFQGTKDKKIIAQIAALSRLLAKMDARIADSSRPKNRQ
jgi:hypothetical protein